MFLKRVIMILFFLLASAYADSLIVKNKRKSFLINYGKNEIKIKGHLLNLSMTRNKCNDDIMDRFNLKMKKLLKTKPLSNFKGDNDIAFKLGGKEYFEHTKSRVGNSLSQIPNEIQRMKFEEKFKCGKINTSEK